MKKILIILFLLISLMLIGCSAPINVIKGVENKQIVMPDSGISYLLVDLLDEENGINLFVDLKNVQDGTIKKITINGVEIQNFSGGQGIFKRFSKAIFHISEMFPERIWDRNYRAWRYIRKIHIIIHVDCIQGKTRNPHWSKDYWVSPDGAGQSTIKLEF